MPMICSRIWDRSGLTSPFSPRLASKRVIAFYTPGSDRCSLHAVVWDNTGPAGSLAARVRISLEPGQIVQIDTAQDGSLKTSDLGAVTMLKSLQF